MSDKGFYNGWTGGVFSLTPRIQGSLITKRAKGDAFCRKYYGIKSQMAEFHMGHYFPKMNGPPAALVSPDWKW